MTILQFDATAVSATSERLKSLIDTHYAALQQVYAGLGRHGGCMCHLEKAEDTGALSLKPSKLLLDLIAGLERANEALAALPALFELHELQKSGGARQ